MQNSYRMYTIDSLRRTSLGIRVVRSVHIYDVEII